MNQLFLFNPDCEMAIANGSQFYTPPVNVAKMAEDLAFLPAWLGEAGDKVLVHFYPDDFFLQTVCQPLNLPVRPVLIEEVEKYMPLCGQPWGRSPKMGFWLSTHGVGQAWKEEEKEWYSRKKARMGLVALLERMPDLEKDIVPQVCSSLDEIERQIKGGDYMIKAPWSSSGKGILAIAESLGRKEKEWIGGILRRQGYMMLERRLNRQQDFAMEFFKNEQGCQFLGWSSFCTGEHGEYRGNLLVSQKRIEEDLAAYLSPQKLSCLKEELPKMLDQLFPDYQGYLGVDMMIYITDEGKYALQPCVEVNLRCNMGIMALLFFQRYLHMDTNGKFEICYYAEQGEALEVVSSLCVKYPAVYKNNRLVAGYLNLTPVTKSTHFVASVHCY